MPEVLGGVGALEVGLLVVAAVIGTLGVAVLWLQARIGPAEAIVYMWLLGTAAVGRLFAYVGAGGVYVTEVTLGVAYLYLAIAVLLRAGRLDRVRKAPVLMLTVLVLAVVGAIQIVRGMTAYGSGAIQDGVLLGYVVFLALPFVAFRSARSLRRMLAVVVVAGTLSACVYSVAKVLVFAGALDAAEVQRSLVSQVSSTFIGVALLIVVVAWAHRMGLNTWLAFGLMLLLGTAIVIGEARSSWLGMVIGLGYLVAHTKAGARSRMILLVAASGIAAVPLIGALGLVTGFDVFGLLRDEVISAFDFNVTTELNASGANAQFRLLILADGLARFLANPWLGEGFGGGGFVHERGTELVETSFHNSHLAILVRTGVVGYLFFACVIAAWWRACNLPRRLARVTEDRAILSAIKAAVVFMLVSFGFFHALEAPYVGPFFWLVLGLGAAIAADARTEASRWPSQAPVPRVDAPALSS